ncbi:hypothetical protein DDB_G0281777 [Dictyostelium discoideum AX4]|uniref:SIAH-type domain-containing protein n=1 Tax=Dictyostelium discoideum TaxID=44689 RepID=Q54TF7_DICDI|nr:hypothetical protein DDB_G0281777 [Dictyostelium discoideum AX4]EAL66650.1 hypothetical protein DDB_G0281777 [Dictyostelium discoideum AX4]|eukprot:XP_640634.1 hypothetical protein DDB_G0281777 [Dictyostelium discoideum AX4]
MSSSTTTTTSASNSSINGTNNITTTGNSLTISGGINNSNPSNISNNSNSVTLIPNSNSINNSNNNNNNNSISNNNNNNNNTPKKVIIVDSSIVECGICYSNQFSKSYSCDYCDFWTCESCLPCYLSKQCPKCKRAWPKIPKRNYTIERLVEEAQVPCDNYSDGCVKKFKLKDEMGKKALHQDQCPYRKIPCPLGKILGCQMNTIVSPEDMEKHFENHHRLDSVYLHDQERETEFFRMTMMSPLPKGTETSCLLLKQEQHTILFISTGEGVFRSFLFLFVTPPPKRYQIRVYGTSSSQIKINDKPQIWADICDTLPLVSFTISQQQYLKWSHSTTSRSFYIHLKAIDEEEEEDDDDDEEEDDEEEDEDDEDEDEDEKEKESDDDSSSGGSGNNGHKEKERFLKKLKVK